MSRFFASYLVFIFALSFSSFSLAQETAAPLPAAPAKGFTPDLGINALFLYQNSDRGNEPWAADRNGASLQEAELQFSADVDPYWRFASTFALHQEVEVDDTTTPPTRSAEYVFEPEEAFAETIALPSVTARVGKFKAAFGKHNRLHTHAFAFIDAPMMNSALLGDEGLNDVGASLSALIPLSWFSEFTLQGFSGQGEGLDYFHGRSANDGAYVAHLKNLWDLTDEATIEFGLSGATGQNQSASSTNLFGVDLTFKWRADKGRALTWSTEAISREINQAAKEEGRGLVTWLQYQFAVRWWAQVRSEYLEFKDTSVQRKQSVLIGFIPSEFSGIRMQYDRMDDGAPNPEQKVMLQLSYSIGAHPAHAY